MGPNLGTLRGESRKTYGQRIQRRREEKRSDQKEKELSSFTPMIKNLDIPKNKIILRI